MLPILSESLNSFLILPTILLGNVSTDRYLSFCIHRWSIVRSPDLWLPVSICVYLIVLVCQDTFLSCCHYWDKVSCSFGHHQQRWIGNFYHNEPVQRFFRHLDGIYDVDECMLLFQRFCILPSPCWWLYLFIPTLILYHMLSIVTSWSFISNVLLYGILIWHDWWATMVVIWPTAPKTWTMYRYNALGTNFAFIAIVDFSWSYIFWPMYVIACGSRMVLFMTL